MKRIQPNLTDTVYMCRVKANPLSIELTNLIAHLPKVERKMFWAGLEDTVERRLAFRARLAESIKSTYEAEKTLEKLEDVIR